MFCASAPCCFSACQACRDVNHVSLPDGSIQSIEHPLSHVWETCVQHRETIGPAGPVGCMTGSRRIAESTTSKSQGQRCLAHANLEINT
eukprot:9866574-Karenia_brevis.AAC.1